MKSTFRTFIAVCSLAALGVQALPAAARESDPGLFENINIHTLLVEQELKELFTFFDGSRGGPSQFEHQLLSEVDEAISHEETGGFIDLSLFEHLNGPARGSAHGDGFHVETSNVEPELESFFEELLFELETQFGGSGRNAQGRVILDLPRLKLVGPQRGSDHATNHHVSGHAQDTTVTIAGTGTSSGSGSSRSGGSAGGAGGRR